MNAAPIGLDPLTYNIFAASFDLGSPERTRAFRDVAAVAEEYLAPFITKIAVDMLPEITAAVRSTPGAAVVFQGRDGFAFGHAFAALAPEFYAAHCVPMYLSRSLVHSALCALENSTSAAFPDVEPFRQHARWSGDFRAAWHRLTAYFLANGIPIGAPGSVVHLVDTGLKGSIQEMLAAVYPQTAFVGHLAFHAAAAADPHPGSKRGYLLHLDAVDSSNGNAVGATLPADKRLTFLHRTAILAVERLVQGSHCSPTGFGPNGKPHAPRARHDPRPLEHIDPARVSSPYDDPRLREGIRSIQITAICRQAAAFADRAATGPNWFDSVEHSVCYVDLARRSDAFVDQVRAWVSGDSACDDRLRTILDAFVPRT
ncbi:hypothetical protein [Nocardia amamiensis]|uniref:hypothetical protein n=1 Tax=Nocardia amamiensis TaxID=404578 RepID=UPI000833B2C4|nr:hypothetical protein [Nocardia amamiensis]